MSRKTIRQYVDELLAELTLINDAVESVETTYSSSKIQDLIDAGGGGGGAVLLATIYDSLATDGILICSQYNPNA